MSGIDLTKVNWSQLNPEEFAKIERQMVEEKKRSRKLAKKNQPTGNIVVNLRGMKYELPVKLVNRLRNLKSDTSKSKLIDKIVEDYAPVRELTL